MTRTIRIIFLLFLNIFVLHYGHTQSSFNIHIGTEINDFIRSADNDKDDCTVFVGISSIGDLSQPTYSRLIKVYPDGHYIQRVISLPDSLFDMSYIKVLTDGNYFVVTQKNKHSNPDSEPNLMEIQIYDTALTLLSKKLYTLPESYKAYKGVGSECSMVEDNDGNLILATTLSYYEGSTFFRDFIFYKFNLQGDTLVSKVYETWYDALPFRLTKVPNSNELMLISQGYLPATEGELMFLDTNLDLLRVKRTRHTRGTSDSKKWLSDSTFIIVNDSVQPRPGQSSEYMTKLSFMDINGKYLKSIALNHADTIEYVTQYEGMSYFNDSTIYISSVQSYNNLSATVPNEVFLYLIDTALNILGYKKLGDGHYYLAHGNQAAPDGGCFVWASRWKIPYDNNWGDIWIWKVMPEDMTLTTHVNYLPPGRIQGHAWPNPVDDAIFISLEAFAQGETIHYRITDMQGRTCLYLKQTVTGNCLHTQTQNLEPGMYIYEITGQNNKTISGKFIKN